VNRKTLTTYAGIALAIIVLVFSAWAIGRAWDYTIEQHNSPDAPNYTHTTE
jgi:hypothetical protein